MNIEKYKKIYEKYERILPDDIKETFDECFESVNLLNSLYKDLIKLNNKMKSELAALQKENEELLTHVKASPDGELYLEARDHYNKAKK